MIADLFYGYVLYLDLNHICYAKYFTVQTEKN